MTRVLFAARCLSLSAGCEPAVDVVSGGNGGWTIGNGSGGGTAPGDGGTGAGTGGGEEDLVFQPAFHQALRWSMNTGGVVTFRMKVPVHRSGERLKVTFRSGDGTLNVVRANVAKAGSDGALASIPVPLTFDGSEGATTGARTRLTSDPAELPVAAGDELAVSFEVNGALSAASIGNFPGSYARSGNHSRVTSSLGGTQHPRMVGLATIDVEGPKTRAAVALGDSITEGYVSGATTSGTTVSAGYLAVRDDYRNAWNAVASGLLGGPIVNAGVSGQGTYDAQQNLTAEVLSLEGLTDCVVLLGTNDLAGVTVAQLQARLQQIFDTLAQKCRVWAGTLLPKERTSRGTLSAVQADRRAVNAWIRDEANVHGVIDFEAATRSDESVDRFRAGYGEDGIHPSVEGQAAMGRAAAAALVEDPTSMKVTQDVR